MTTEAQKDYLGMSDEDFLKAPMPVVEAGEQAEAADQGATPGSEAAQTDAEKEAAAVAAAAAETQKNEELAKGDDDDAGKENADGDDDAETIAAAEKLKADEEAKAKANEGKTPEQIAAEAEAARVAAEAEKEKKPQTDAEKAAAAAAEKAAKPVDYQAFFKQVMTPFKANGRTIELKTPEEAIRLMQMGAGYGRKIQDLQPHLKAMRMLEKNGLLDEGKLSFLIDINDKNPEAIKKIIKDSGIDPLDLNIADNVSYIPKNHSVSDQEMAFKDALSDIQSHEGGQETLQEINQKWDQESKSALWAEPALLAVIQSQRDNGVYDQIAAEIDRQKLLGAIPNSTPFLKAYKLAGDHLQATNGFKLPAGQAEQIQKQPGDTQQPQVIAVRPANVKAPVANGDKAAAASPTKTETQRKAKSTVNPLEMADDEFLKQFNGRL
ncbi:hypothetical protein X766_15870 [Mesorhizobium sp. LSJC255A00]|uniref:hypothetical protein n=1 Tax=Mesorhizobium sp. LSJC255A00 TaxID=1287313 RepID=UPI0003CF7708|nr:hypothetical protein [Mesorhizobium sp. LSJC255A00]ESX17874.1 hypothetical protein X766_15870 [Mesorhizobium sp. LSJC255A00]